MFCVAGRYENNGLRYFLCLVNFLSVLAIFILYGITFRAACRPIKLIHDRRQALRNVGFIVFRRTLKSAKSCGSIVLFFAVTYLPVCINSIFYEMRNVSMSIFNDRSAWFLALVFLNCTLNPFLYCAFSSNLRAIICKMLRSARSSVLREIRACWQRSRRVSSVQRSDQLGNVMEMSSAFSILRPLITFCNTKSTPTPVHISHVRDRETRICYCGIKIVCSDEKRASHAGLKASGITFAMRTLHITTCLEFFCPLQVYF